MRKKLMLFLNKSILTLLVCFSLVNAVSANTDLSTKHKAAIGIHGMAIFTDGVHFYASHMPLVNSIHAHQVIFSFELDSKYIKTLNELLESSALVSVMPERFDLIKLMSGELKSFKGIIFQNHFERGGKAKVRDVTFRVKDILLSSDLLENSNDNGKYYLINTSMNHGFLVHRIVDKPSFDQIVRVVVSPLSKTSEARSQVLPRVFKITDGQPVSLTKPTKLTFSNHTLILKQPVYLETKDFQ